MCDAIRQKSDDRWLPTQNRGSPPVPRQAHSRAILVGSSAVAAHDANGGLKGLPARSGKAGARCRNHPCRRSTSVTAGRPFGNLRSPTVSYNLIRIASSQIERPHGDCRDESGQHNSGKADQYRETSRGTMPWCQIAVTNGEAGHKREVQRISDSPTLDVPD